MPAGSGRIFVFVRNKYWSNTKILTSNNSSCLWFRINKNVLGFDKDLLCGALYIPPEGSKYSDIGMFDDLTTDLINFNNANQYYVLIMGDFNSRTGTDTLQALQFYV